MLAFLLAILIFALGVGINAQPAVIPDDIISGIENHISHVDQPQGDPIIPHPNTNFQNGDDNDGVSGNGQNGQPSDLPNTSLVAAYNNHGGIVIDNVAQVAVDNSPSLDSCTDEPKLCSEPSGPGNSQSAPVGPPNGGPIPHQAALSSKVRGV